VKLCHNIAKAYVFRFLQYTHFFAGVLVPFFTVWGGIQFHQVMILQASFMIFTFVLEVPTGVVVDRFGLRTSLILSGLVGTIAAIVYTSYANFWVFMLGEFLWATGMALSSGADQALVYDSLKELSREHESKKIFGRLGSMIPLPLIIAAPLGSYIAKVWGLRSTVLLVAVPMFLSALIAMTFVEPAVKSQHEKKRYLKILREGVSYFKNHRELKILAFDYIAITSLAFLILWLNQLVLERMGVAIEWFGVVFATMFVLEMILMNTFDPLERFLGGKRRYALTSALIAGVSCIVIALFINAWVSAIAIILMGGFGLSRVLLMQNYMNKFIESGHRATIISTISMLLGLSQALIRLASGYMADWNLKVTLFIIGGLIIAFAVFSGVEEEHLID
jgi:MFS family permease